MTREALKVEIPEHHDGGMDDYRAHVNRAKEPLFEEARKMGLVGYGSSAKSQGLGGVYSTWVEPGHESDLLPLHFAIVDSGLFVLPREAALTEHLIEFPITTMENFAEAMRSAIAFFARNPYIVPGNSDPRNRLSYARIEEFLSILAGDPPREVPPISLPERFPSRGDFSWLKVGTDKQ